MAVNAGKAMVKAYMDDSALRRGLDRAQAKLRAFGAGVNKIGRRITGVGVAIAGMLGTATVSFMRFGDQIDKMSKRTGVGAEALSEISFAAEQSGASLDDFEKGVKRMARTISDANSGLATYVRAFDRIGLKAEDLAAMSPEDAFRAIAAAIAATEDPLIRATAAQEIFGRAGTMLLPMLENFEALREEAQLLGVTLTGDDAAAAADLTDAMNRVKRSFVAATVAIGAALAPALESLAARTTAIVGKTVVWLKENRGLIVSVAKLALKVIGLGVGLMIVGKALQAAAVAMKLFRFATIGATLAVKGLGIVIALLSAHPIIAIVTAVAALVLALGGAAYLKRKFAAATTDVISEEAELRQKLKDTKTAVEDQKASIAALTKEYENLGKAAKDAGDKLPSYTFGRAGAPEKLYEVVGSGLSVEQLMGPMGKLHRAVEDYRKLLDDRDSLVEAIGRAQERGSRIDFLQYAGGLEETNRELTRGREEIEKFIQRIKTDLPSVATTFADRLDAAMKTVGADVGSTGAAAADALADRLRQLETEEQRLAQQRSDREIQARIDAAIETDPFAARTWLERMLAANEEAASDLNNRYRYALDAAFSDGLITDEEEQRLNNILRQWQSAEGWTDRIGQNLERAGAAVEAAGKKMPGGENVGEAAGTFSAVAAFGMGFGSSTMDRVANATEETAKNTRDLNARDQVRDPLTFK